MSIPRQTVFSAHRHADLILEETCQANQALVDHGLRIAARHRLHLSDITSPPPGSQNILHSELTILFEVQDHHTSPVAGHAEAARLLDRLLDMVTVLAPYISMLRADNQSLFDLLYPGSMWSVARSVVTGWCCAAGQDTVELVDRWIVRSNGGGGGGNWDAVMGRAEDLIVEARLFLAAESTGLTTETDDEGGIPQAGDTVEEVIDVGAVAVVECAILDDAADQDGTATGSVVAAGTSLTRRRNRWSEGI